MPERSCLENGSANHENCASLGWLAVNWQDVDSILSILFVFWVLKYLKIFAFSLWFSSEESPVRLELRSSTEKSSLKTLQRRLEATCTRRGFIYRQTEQLASASTGMLSATQIEPKREHPSRLTTSCWNVSPATATKRCGEQMIRFEGNKFFFHTTRINTKSIGLRSSELFFTFASGIAKSLINWVLLRG